MSTPVGLKLAHIAAYIDFVPMVLIGESQRFVFHIPLTRCTLLALAVPLSRFRSRVGGGSAFFVRCHSR